MKDSSYFAITPAHNEEIFLPGLIASIVVQAERPKRWLLIDDGSTDRTAEIIDDAASRYSWIEPCHLSVRRERASGGESVVMRCLREQPWGDCGFLLRADADVTFGPDFVALLRAEFAKEPRLGIAGGTLFQKIRGRWHPVVTPQFHSPGAAKIYSRVCFEAIGGLESGLGWDTIDEMRAIMLGFKTRSFRHVKAFHHRKMGSATGLWRGRVRMGEAAYNAGYLPLFMMVRAMRHSFAKPWLMGGALMLIGYMRPWLRRQPPVAEPELVRFVRAQQWRRLTFSDSVWR